MFGRLSREVGPLTDRGRANSIQSCSSERWGYFACPRNSFAAEDPKRDQYKSKADIVAFVKKSFADGATAIQAKGEKGMTTEVEYFPQQKSRVLDIAHGIIEHSGEHYGQLVVYYRLAGLVPPESRPKK
jgi:uncharacterized damage-inducible protein DinB